MRREKINMGNPSSYLSLLPGYYKCPIQRSLEQAFSEFAPTRLQAIQELLACSRPQRKHNLKISQNIPKPRTQ
ncbi:unnamed protein product [Leptosia nina]|uniref:Uncharacterized protein n=1 Tax=Leptosia nina TaxID=320188 RepID=A0AAV1JHK7_9NEOP